MSTRFEIILQETLGPFGKLILKDAIFSSNINSILKFKNLNLVEQLMLSSSEKLPDCRKTFMILFILSIKKQIPMTTLQEIYSRLQELKEKLNLKIGHNPSDSKSETLINISKCFLRSRYNFECTEKFLALCRGLIGLEDEKIININPYFVIIEDFFEYFEGVVLRGQCRFNYLRNYSGGIGFMKKFDPMKIIYQGSLDDIYSNCRDSLDYLKSQLKLLNIQILVSDLKLDWVKDACAETSVAYFESPHPLDLNHLYTTTNLEDADLFTYFYSSAQILTLPHRSLLKIYTKTSKTVLLPELLGNDYHSSLISLIKLWKMFEKTPILVDSGLLFEINIAKEVKSTGLDSVFTQYIRKVLEKLPKGFKLYKDLLTIMNTNTLHSLHIELDNGGQSTFRPAANNSIEVFESKFLMFQTLIEVLIQYTRIDHSIPQPQKFKLNN